MNCYDLNRFVHSPATKWVILRVLAIIVLLLWPLLITAEVTTYCYPSRFCSQFEREVFVAVEVQCTEYFYARTMVRSTEVFTVGLHTENIS